MRPLKDFRTNNLKSKTLFLGILVTLGFNLLLSAYVTSPNEKSEKTLRKLVEHTEQTQPTWSSAPLKNEICRVTEKKSRGNLTTRLACQTPLLNLALLDAALSFDFPLNGGDLQAFLTRVDEKNRELERSLAELEGVPPHPLPIIPGHFESERKELLDGVANENRIQQNLIEGRLAFMNHLIADGAASEQIRSELDRLIKDITDSKFYVPASGSSLKTKVAPAKIHSMYEKLHEAKEAYLTGDTDQTDGFFYELIKLAKESGDKNIKDLVFDSYRQFLHGIRYRPNHELYNTRHSEFLQ